MLWGQTEFVREPALIDSRNVPQRITAPTEKRLAALPYLDWRLRRVADHFNGRRERLNL